MILDDGGDATLLVHARRARPRADDAVLRRRRRQRGRGDPLRRRSRRALARATRLVRPRIGDAIKGVTEETTTGVHRLYQMARGGPAAVPGDQRQRLGHQVEVRQPVRLPRVAGRRHHAARTDVMMAGKVAVVCGYGDVGKGSAAVAARRWRPRDGHRRSTRSARCRRRWKAIEVVTMEDAVDDAPTSSSPRPATCDVITLEHMRDDEGPRRSSATSATSTTRSRSPRLKQLQVGRTSSRRSTMIDFPDGEAHHPAVRGPPREPRQRHRPSRAS